MDKKKVIELAQDIYDSEFSSEPARQRLYAFVAEILLEAAKVCGERSKEFAEERDEEGFSRFGECIGAYACKYKLDQIAKVLTE